MMEGCCCGLLLREEDLNGLLPREEDLNGLLIGKECCHLLAGEEDLILRNRLLTGEED